MKKSIGAPVAEALFGELSAFHVLSGKLLQGVRYVYDQQSLDQVVLAFGVQSLVVKADPDDDSVEFRVARDVQADGGVGIDVSELEPWRPLVGKPFGWGWVTINQQGYCDGVLISFEGIHPQLLLTVEASSIVVSAVKRL